MAYKVDSMTDEEVVQYYLEITYLADFQQVIDNQKSEFTSQIEEDHYISPEAKEEMGEKWAVFIKDKADELISQLSSLSLKVYTVEDMRIILRFHEQYPELYAKSRVLAVEVGRLLGEWLLTFMDDVAEFVDDMLGEKV